VEGDLGEGPAERELGGVEREPDRRRPQDEQRARAPDGVGDDDRPAARLQQREHERDLAERHRLATRAWVRDRSRSIYRCISAAARRT
jgi:hypothetical protein